MIAKEVTRTHWQLLSDNSCVLKTGKSGLPTVPIADGDDEAAMAYAQRLHELHHEEALRSLYASLAVSLVPYSEHGGFTLELNGKCAVEHADLMRWVWGNPDEYTLKSPAKLLTDVCLAATKAVPALSGGSGCLGRQFQEYVLLNEGAVRALLKGLSEKYVTFNLVAGGAGIAALIVGATLVAKSAGIPSPDVRRFQFAVIGALTRVDDKIRRKTTPVLKPSRPVLWRMVQELLPAVLVTAKQKFSGELPQLRGFLTGRAIEDIDRLLLIRAAVTRWCAENNTTVADIERAAEQSGCLVTLDSREYVGRGTPIHTGQARCMTFKWSKVKEHTNADPA